MITRNKAIGFVLSAVAVLMLAGSSAQAQSGSKSYGASRASEISSNNSISRFGVSQFSSANIRNQLSNQSVTRSRTARPNLGSYRPPSSSQSSKPFSSISRSPTVSPYLALSSTFNQVSDYYNIVRPQREQQRVNQQLQRQNQANRHRLNQLAARGPYSPRGNENAAPTGHAAVFQSLGTYLNTGGYYSGTPAPRR